LLSNQGGRRRSFGERYPSGGLKSPHNKESGDVRAPTLVRRIMDHAVSLGVHPYAATQLGRLRIEGALNDAEVAAGFKIADIVGRHERYCCAPRRTVASPAYERSYGGAIDPYEAGDQNTIARYERRVSRARKDYERILRNVPPGGAIELVMSVCVDDVRVNGMHHGDLKALLTRMAKAFGLERERRKG